MVLCKKSKNEINTNHDWGFFASLHGSGVGKSFVCTGVAIRMVALTGKS